MGYFVIAQDGNRYGPADIATLQQWVREGRIAPNTTLEDEFTGTQMRASLLPELSYLFPNPEVPPADTYQQPRPMTGGGPSSKATTALVLGILGLICCGLLGIPAIIIGKQEMASIDEGLAPVEGRGLAQAGFILGIVSLVLWAVGMLMWIAAFSSMRSLQ